MMMILLIIYTKIYMRYIIIILYTWCHKISGWSRWPNSVWRTTEKGGEIFFFTASCKEKIRHVVLCTGYMSLNQRSSSAVDMQSLPHRTLRVSSSSTSRNASSVAFDAKFGSGTRSGIARTPFSALMFAPKAKLAKLAKLRCNFSNNGQSLNPRQS